MYDCTDYRVCTTLLCMNENEHVSPTAPDSAEQSLKSLNAAEKVKLNKSMNHPGMLIGGRKPDVI